MSWTNSVVLSLGFRPFFTVAAIFSILATVAWLPGREWPGGSMTAMGWHAHEMIFGYAMAVVAGFLLTAARNWTGVQLLGAWLRHVPGALSADADATTH